MPETEVAESATDSAGSAEAARTQLSQGGDREQEKGAEPVATQEIPTPPDLNEEHTTHVQHEEEPVRELEKVIMAKTLRQ